MPSLGSVDIEGRGGHAADPFVRVFAAALINVAALWLAEILTCPTPTDVEPMWVLLVALGVYGTVASVAAVLSWAVLVRSRAWQAPRLISWWLAFAPGIAIVFPVARQALRVDAIGAAMHLALLLGAGVVLGLAWRRAARGWAFAAAYACGVLALWSIALCLRHVASNVPLTAPELEGALAAVRVTIGSLYLTSLVFAAMAARSGRTVALLSLVVCGIVVGRFVIPSAMASATDVVAERHAGGARATPVVLIVMDTTRADHLSVYGYPRRTTPVLEAFAREALVFDNAVAPSPWTLPSHASLFTGLFPLRHGADRPPWTLGDETLLSVRGCLSLPLGHPTLANWFREHGYDTAAVVANFGYLDPAFGLAQGFTFYQALPNTPVKPLILSLVHRRLVPIAWAARYWRSEQRAEQINRTALSWLDRRQSDAVFLFLNYMEPHAPWTTPGRHYAEFAAEAEDPWTPLRPGALTPEMRQLVDWYDSHIAALDHALGELFDALRRVGLYDRALIIVTADHGDSRGENGVVGHGRSLHAPEISIPLLIKYPSSDRVGRRAARVSLVDIWPTVGVALGFDLPPGLDGEPVDRVAHPILAEFYTDPRAGRDLTRRYQAVLYEGGQKLRVDAEQRAELFDIQDDPSESRSLDVPPSGALAERRAWLLERHRTLEGNLRTRTATAAPVDPRVRKALGALGYVDN